MSQGIEAFLCSGDVYRRDEIDSSHYPVFHQMEGVRIFLKSSPQFVGLNDEQRTEIIVEDLKGILGGLAKHLFGDVEMRWNSEYFPFTDPSFELEVLFQGKWLEVLGCGVVHKEVMANGKRSEDFGWAFGLGLERLAMVLFGIPDIRLFWTEDVRFSSQFNESKKHMTFVPYSKYPICYKDVSFWLPDSGLHPNDVYELIRGIAGDLVESVELFDQFTNKKTGRTSHAYRINYRHMDRNLTNEEINELQSLVRQQLQDTLKVTLR
jgi:phenylalanyl-tRNA synthetase alpha chain